jgi:predicted phosphodiesterase
MKKIALFSDVHGNITGLRRVLQAINNLDNVTMIVGLGDFFGGGPGLNDIMEVLDENKVNLIRGNMEDYLISPADRAHRVPQKYQTYMQETADWINSNLHPDYISRITSLPLYKVIKLDGKHELPACHAAKNDPWKRICSPAASEFDLKAEYGQYTEDIIAYGHAHEHFVMPFHSKTLINVASVGLRKDGLSHYTIIEYSQDSYCIRQESVPYDTDEERELSIQRKTPSHSD